MDEYLALFFPTGPRSLQHLDDPQTSRRQFCTVFTFGLCALGETATEVACITKIGVSKAAKGPEISDPQQTAFGITMVSNRRCRSIDPCSSH
jgi:hypothetical protein